MIRHDAWLGRDGGERMQLNQFLEKLAMTPRAWYIRKGCLWDDRLRLTNPDGREPHCPITAVAHDMGIADAWRLGCGAAPLVSKAIGLSDITASRVISAADGVPSYAQLRARLLKACGLRAAEEG